MLIGIDGSRTAKDAHTGTELYSTKLIQTLMHIDNENQYILYTPKDLTPRLGNLPNNFSQNIIPFKKLWTQIRLSWEMLKDSGKLDVLFVPSHTIPLIHPKKTVVTVHDLGFLHFPELYSKTELAYQKFGLNMAVKHASHIITPSIYTKKDIVRNFGLNPKKITVVYHGYNNDLYKPRLYPKKEGGELYIFFVGRLEYKKNIMGLIQAYEMLRREPKIKHKLVLAGKPGYGYEEYREFLKTLPENIQKDIIELGYVPDQELAGWVKNADIFFFPSYFEGFGFPVIEAMACGVPVVTSKITSIPEIAGSAAMLVNPNKPFEMAAALSKLINDHKLYKSYISKGKVRSTLFSWEKSANQTLNILENIAKE
ncbi:MAG: glycosyl transferase, group 1 [uncultured bacterium]|nr:MAG: glycosyl transferase, group 1 [uncultured bacterium]